MRRFSDSWGRREVGAGIPLSSREIFSNDLPE
jgi:hypothetical protein